MTGKLEHVVVVGYGRSAVAKSGKKGALRNLHPVEMGGMVLKGILEKIPALVPEEIDDIIVGCAQQELSQAFNMGRLVGAVAGLPESVPGMTVNRFCASGLQSVALAASQIECGMADCIVAGGIESMSSIPIDMEKMKQIISPWIWENAREQYMAMGITAENVASRYGIAREEMDAFAVKSHEKALRAQAEGRLNQSVIPLPGLDADGNEITFDQDQGIRPGTTVESLSKLDPCFKKDGTVTAATSSQTSDGAGFVVLMSEKKAEQLGIEPIAKFIGFAVAGCEAAYMGLGPMYAVPKVMEKTGLALDDMDVIELNEAFASQAIVCMKELGLDPDKVNPNGGAIALGHPLGATGGILSCKILDELQRTGKRYGLVTMCIGGGMGAAGIYEMCG